MSTISCSVGILTHNSSATLARALASVADFADIVVNDGASTDETRAIALSYGARILEQDARYQDAQGRLIDFSGVRNQCLGAARYDWFLYIDSDEAISEELCAAIRRIVSAPIAPGMPLAYRIPLRIVLDGHIIEHASNYPGYQYRFFNRTSGVHYIKPVHERINIDPKATPTGTLSHPWYVYASRDDTRHYLRNTAGYRTLEVEMFRTRSWGDYFRYIVLRNLRTSIGALLRSTANYVRYGFRRCAPIEEELGRVLAPLILVARVTYAKCGGTRAAPRPL